MLVFLTTTMLTTMYVRMDKLYQQRKRMVQEEDVARSLPKYLIYRGVFKPFESYGPIFTWLYIPENYVGLLICLSRSMTENGNYQVEILCNY